ncbi:protein AF-10 isoform X3 [Pectinophora gossypiella]|uniref:protein AF-10 isoform X3 n=1 Tax=Pectinophora gossypiella TaxID=13191 RepID=UPI00214E30FB|nr:protein AF-10 isoform X3 [Pectinophora gossypiella]
MKEMVGGCCVCSDERGWPDNPLVYCDGNGCTVAVHQACYGIVTVPTGPWYCRKCESPDAKIKVRCELCPSKSGALKRTDTGGWAHVVCALYIPEVRFGNVTSMEPIVLRLIPQERFSKICYICQDSHKAHRATAGACMQCNKSGCKQQFHVTCAQSLGLLCEEAGNYLDNVKYCGYCQHHYGKLVSKKGGNVKTIPPYKPVSHDSQSSDSSGGEKEGGNSPQPGSSTPTQTTKKGPGRKSSAHASGSGGGKNTPSTSKASTSTQPDPEVETPAAPARKHKDKNKKKPSPSRRGSSAGEGGGSKASTPAPSPQHTSDASQQPTKGGSTPGGNSKVTPPSASPGSKHEPAGVISSVASATAASATVTSAPPSTNASTSVVQVATSKPSYQESVITNTESVETKQTKKRKAVSAANTPTAPLDYAATPPPNALDANSQSGSSTAWDNASTDVQMEAADKLVKKAKTEGLENVPLPPSHFSSVSPAPPPPPPPAHSPASQPSPRHLPSPMPGPSGMSTAHMRSPSQPPGGKSERDAPASLLVSVPLPSTSHGLNLSAHAQVSVPSEMGPSPHIFHQPQKQAAMEPNVPSHSSHGMPGRAAWGGLNVAYEMQQDPNKPGVSGVAGPSKEPVPLGMVPLPPATIRNKKRAAMATSVVSMATVPAPPPPLPTPTQSLASVRRHPQPTPPPIYHETIKDSPPSSPSSERPLKPKMETKIGASCTAPHMLGNELNPDSGAAARLQEQLTAELAAHAAGSAGGDVLIPPPLINKALPGSSGTRGGSSAQSLDQLLERQWEQGSQFLMEQAQHFDIASLLSCLHQLRTENVRLEEHVGSLLQRRDHLLAVNARLAIPLTTVPPGPPEPQRCPRENGSQVRGPPPSVRAAETITSERSHQLRTIVAAGENYIPQYWELLRPQREQLIRQLAPSGDIGNGFLHLWQWHQLLEYRAQLTLRVIPGLLQEIRSLTFVNNEQLQHQVYKLRRQIMAIENEWEDSARRRQDRMIAYQRQLMMREVQQKPS